MMRPLQALRRRPARRDRRGRHRNAVCTWCAARLAPGQWQCPPGYGCRSEPLTPAEIERLLRP